MLNGLNSSPVGISLPGLNQKTDDNNSGFNSPIGESSPDMQAYTIPPVLWVIVFLIVGYIGIRYFMED